MSDQPTDQTPVSELPGYIREAVATAEASNDEVIAARGDFSTLNGRISAAINPDGSLVTSVTVATFVAETADPTRASTSTFTVTGDLTGRYVLNRPVRFGSSTYSFVLSSSYNGGTGLTTVSLSTAVVPNPITTLYYGMNPAEMPRTTHANLYQILGADETSTDTTKNKHVSNSQLRTLTLAASSASSAAAANALSIASLQSSKLNISDVRGNRGKYIRLDISPNGSSPYSKLNISADGLTVETVASLFYKITTFSTTVDITILGAGGRDAGNEAANTWYYVWVIYGTVPGVSAVLSSSPVTPTFPSGYSYAALVGAVYNDANSNFVGFIQHNHRVVCASKKVISNAFSSSYTLRSIAVGIPWTAYKAIGSLCVLGSGSALLAATSGGYGELGFATGGPDAVFPYEIALVTNQTIYTRNTLVPLDLYISGWEY